MQDDVKHKSSTYSVFVQYLWDICELFVRYAWLGMKWWSLVEAAVKQAVVLPLFMYEIIPIAALLLTQVLRFCLWRVLQIFVLEAVGRGFHVWNDHNWLKFARTQAPLCAKSNQTNIDQQRKALTREGKGGRLREAVLKKRNFIKWCFPPPSPPSPICEIPIQIC